MLFVLAPLVLLAIAAVGWLLNKAFWFIVAPVAFTSVYSFVMWVKDPEKWKAEMLEAEYRRNLRKAAKIKMKR